MRIGPMEALVLVALFVFVVVMLANARSRRPASESLEQIFAEPSAPLPGTKARTWALGVLYEAGVDADADPSYAMKVLRRAEPRLSPEAATLLIDTLNAG